MTLRYAIIGSGMMGQEHIRNIALMEGATVVAVSDPDEGMRRAAAKEAGAAQTFADYKDLLSADLCDAYVIASPNDTHHGVMLDVMAAGKPVLCEKPLCTTSADCRDLLGRASAPVWVAMEYRFMPPFQGLLNEVKRGTAGAPKMMSIREHRFPFLVKVGDWNRFNARTGGTLVEKCCHFWDLMRLTLGADPLRVFASAGVDVNHLDESYDGATPDILDNAFVVVDFANGTRGMLDLCMFAEGSKWQEIISVTGDRARVDMRIPGPRRLHPDATDHHAEIEISDRSQVSSRTEIVEVAEELLWAGDHHGSTFYQHLKFRDMVAEGRSDPEVSLQDGLWSVLVGEAAEQSAREHRAIELDPHIMILITEFMDEAAVDAMRAAHPVTYDPSLADRQGDIPSLLAGVAALIVRNRTRVTPEVLDAAPDLKCVGRLGVGLDNIDMKACAAREVTVYPAIGANNLSVAEYVISTAMQLLRGAYDAKAAMLAGDWPRQACAGRELAGKTLGLVGFGAIAQDTAALAKGLGMTIAAYDPYLPDDHAAWSGVARCTREEVLPHADVLSLHVPLTDETRHLIDAKALKAMKHDAILINAARGGTLDEAALAAALKAGALGGAALDVFEVEPMTAASGATFADVPNLILTPHIAGVTEESNERVSELIAQKVLAHL